jgi:hypothetical protein
VHVVVCIDRVSIEIQIRTLVQHLWADLMERLADRLGRQIRYGGPPNAMAGLTVVEGQLLIDGMMSFSERWAGRTDTGPRDAALRLQELADDLWSDLGKFLNTSDQ